MDWKRLTKLMLPIRLRHGKRLMRLIGGLTVMTTTDADIAETYKDAEKVEARRIGQKKVVEEMLKSRFGNGITITGQEDGKVQIFGHYEQEKDYRKICPDKSSSTGAVIVTDVDGTDVGCDFRVTVPQGVDTKAVEKLVRSMVLAGVGFRVTVNS